MTYPSASPDSPASPHLQNLESVKNRILNLSYVFAQLGALEVIGEKQFIVL